MRLAVRLGSSGCAVILGAGQTGAQGLRRRRGGGDELDHGVQPADPWDLRGVLLEVDAPVLYDEL